MKLQKKKNFKTQTKMFRLLPATERFSFYWLLLLHVNIHNTLNVFTIHFEV